MAFPNLSDIVATTTEARNRSLADNVTNGNVLLAKLKSEGGVKPVSGGSVIMEEIEYAENQNAVWYSGYDLLPTGPTEIVSAATYPIKQMAVPVTISGLEKLQNSGRAQIIDLLDARITNAEKTMKNVLSRSIYSDGTAFNGKQLTGLGAAITVTPNVGVYGGIDRAVWSFWRNQKMKGGGVDFAGALTPANVGTVWTTMYLRLQQGIGKVNLIIADPSYYATYMQSLQPMQRFSDTKTAGLGFDNLMFMSAPVVMESTNSGMPANTAYFLNTEYFKLRPHTDRNMVALDPNKRYSTNQDAEVAIIGWAGNMTSNGLQYQGIVQD